KLRSDLELRPQGINAGAALVVKDRLSGQFFRFREAEEFILRQLDGTASMDVVQRRTEEKFGAALAPEELAAFVKTLDQNGLLEADSGKVGPPRRPDRRVAGNLLYLRIRLLDPDWLLNVLHRRGRFFFTPQFLWLSASLILAAIAVSVFAWSDIVREASRMFQFS